MKKNKNTPGKSSKDLRFNSKDLRELAEAKLLESEINKKDLGISEIKEILHELQVHQIELELQNEELRQAYIACDISTEKYLKLYNFAPIGYITLSEKGMITMANLTAANQFLVMKPELLNSPFTKYIYKEDQDVYYLNINRLLKEKEKHQFDLRIVRSDKSFFWAHLEADFSVNENGDLDLLITIDDISKIKENEEKLLYITKHLKETQTIAHLGNYTMDIVNNKWESSIILDDIFGIDSGYDKSAEGWASIVHPDCRQEMYDYFIKYVVGKGLRFDKEYRIIRQNDKAERWVHGIGELKYDENNKPVLMVGTIADITESKSAQEEIRTKNEQLEIALSEKDKFFSIIAHDLRGPFTGFLGFTELLKSDFFNFSIKELQEIANKMYYSAMNLFGLLNNLLEWSMVKRGLMPFNPVDISLNKTIEEVIGIFSDNAKKKSIEIETEVQKDISVIADKSMLNTILRNLVSNAVKFTKPGGFVRVTVKKFKGSVVITVKDSGVGMNLDLQNNLFKLDGKTGRLGTADEKSSGLGLLLCKEFIEMHKGKISVISEEEKGTEFSVSFPG